MQRKESFCVQIQKFQNQNDVKHQHHTNKDEVEWEVPVFKPNNFRTKLCSSISDTNSDINEEECEVQRNI